MDALLQHNVESYQGPGAFRGRQAPGASGGRRKTYQDDQAMRAERDLLRSRARVVEQCTELREEFEFQEFQKQPPVDRYLDNYYATSSADGAEFEGGEFEDEDPVEREYRERDEQYMHAAEVSLELWGRLYSHLHERLAPGAIARQWLNAKVAQWQATHLAGELDVLDLHSSHLRLSDNGIRRVSRWLIDHTDQLEGVKKVDISSQGAGGIGLKLLADAMPFSCMEVDVAGNTGNGWTHGAVKVAEALRQRGGGVMYCGKASAAELEWLKNALTVSSTRGGQVDVHVHRWGGATQTIEMSSTIHYDAVFYSKPDWTQHLGAEQGARMRASRASATGGGALASPRGVSRGGGGSSSTFEVGTIDTTPAGRGGASSRFRGPHNYSGAPPIPTRRR